MTVNVFLDSSVLLAASGSPNGASRALFQLAPAAHWRLLASPYAISEVLKNVSKFPAEATRAWIGLRRRLCVVDDVVSLNRPVIFAASKDRPILFTALAYSRVLLTLDRADFADILGGQFYGLRVRLPSTFIVEERAAGRLTLPKHGPSR
jgi:predicted nucleic acid-binding protein